MKIQTPKGEFTIHEGSEKMDAIAIHAYLTREYWCEGIGLDIIKKAIENSLCFGAFDAQNNQIGFARLVTDYATFAYLVDVYVLEKYRGLGISKAIMAQIKNHEIFPKLRRIMLATSNAHGLYKQSGFEKLSDPQIQLMMQITRPNIYKS